MDAWKPLNAKFPVNERKSGEGTNIYTWKLKNLDKLTVHTENIDRLKIFKNCCFLSRIIWKQAYSIWDGQDMQNFQLRTLA